MKEIAKKHASWIMATAALLTALLQAYASYTEDASHKKVIASESAIGKSRWDRYEKDREDILAILKELDNDVVDIRVDNAGLKVALDMLVEGRRRAARETSASVGIDAPATATVRKARRAVRLNDLDKSMDISAPAEDMIQQTMQEIFEE